LSQIVGHARVSKSVSRILAAFPGVEAAPAPAAPLIRSPSTTQSGNFDDGPGERLTSRELDVLLLMAEPISLREIAARLNISYTTARRYTINVYGKFGVHSRWEAVESAIRQGIINPR
jgi:DNA-binding NarL/FixJ family response regulator